MTNYVKIFGKQKCGTSYAINIMTNNFVDTVGFNNQFGHKHSAPLSVEDINSWVHLDDHKYKKHGQHLEDIKRGNYIHPVIIIKNPYSWYWSAKRYYWRDKKKLDFEAVYNSFNSTYSMYKEFVESNIPKSGFARQKKIWFDIYNRILFRKKITSTYFHPAYVVRYEDLITKPVKEQFKTIADFFGLKMKKEFTDIKVASKGWDPFTEERRQFYLQRGNFRLKTGLMQKITDIVDWDLMSFYGYYPK